MHSADLGCVHVGVGCSNPYTATVGYDTSDDCFVDPSAHFRTQSPGGTDCLSTLHERCHGFLGYVGNVIVVIEFAIEGNTKEFCRSGQFYGGVVYHQRSEIPFLIPGEHNYFGFEGADGEVFGCAPVHDCVQSFLGAIPYNIKIVAFC